MASLTFQEIVELMKLIEAGSCEELELETEGMKLVIRGGAGASDVSRAGSGASTVKVTGVQETGGPMAGQPTAGDAVPIRTPRSDDRIEVRSPMVGTFYRAPAPDAPPFVDLESNVEPGDTLCMIEVMKLFTTIEASAAGRVVEIAADNGQLVEIDTLLFVVEPR